MNPSSPVAIARRAARLVALYVAGLAVLTQIVAYLPRLLGPVGTYLVVGAALVVGSFAWAWAGSRWWPEDHRTDGQREIDAQLDALIHVGVEADDARARIRARLEREFPAPGGDGGGLPDMLREAMRNGRVEVHRVGRHGADQQDDQADREPVPGAGSYL